jgi:tripartite-type tricarboxylate transporter receptor subunit TctC
MHYSCDADADIEGRYMIRVKLSRRQFLQLAAGAAALPGVSRVAWAKAYPSRSVRVVVPFAPAGDADLVARLIGQWLSERLGQQFVIENRPGAATNVGTEAVVRAPADGYTLLSASTAAAINATLYQKLNFNFIRDIAPVAAVIRAPFVMMINPTVPAQTVPEFIAYAKNNPDKISMASSGVGSGPHAAGELFKMMAGVNMIHVPYRGQGPALTDLISGQVQLYFAALPSSIQYIRTGQLRALAVTTAARSQALPEIPTLSDFLPGYEASFWGGFCAPKGTPVEIIDRLNIEINAALADAKIKTRLADLGATVLPGSPTEFGKLISDETKKWSKVVKFAGMQPE